MLLAFPFDGLPLDVRDDGACGIFCDGVADIDAKPDGRWSVASVKVRLGLHRHGKPSAYRLETPALWVTAKIMHTLEYSPHWHGLVRQAIERSGQPVNLEDRRFRRLHKRQVEV